MGEKKLAAGVEGKKKTWLAGKKEGTAPS